MSRNKHETAEHEPSGRRGPTDGRGQPANRCVGTSGPYRSLFPAKMSTPKKCNLHFSPPCVLISSTAIRVTPVLHPAEASVHWLGSSGPSSEPSCIDARSTIEDATTANPEQRWTEYTRQSQATAEWSSLQRLIGSRRFSLATNTPKEDKKGTGATSSAARRDGVRHLGADGLKEGGPGRRTAAYRRCSRAFI